MTIAKLIYHPITILVITIVAIAFFFSLDKSSRKTQSSNENIKILEYEVNQVSSEIVSLEEKIEDTQSDQFKEKIIRNELLLQKPGEYILQIAESDQIKDENSCENGSCEKIINKDNKSTFSAWRDLLF